MSLLKCPFCLAPNDMFDGATSLENHLFHDHHVINPKTRDVLIDMAECKETGKSLLSRILTGGDISDAPPPAPPERLREMRFTAATQILAGIMAHPETPEDLTDRSMVNALTERAVEIADTLIEKLRDRQGDRAPAPRHVTVSSLDFVEKMMLGRRFTQAEANILVGHIRARTMPEDWNRPRPRVVSDGEILRRSDTESMTAIEASIRDVLLQVESCGAHPRLTEAVVHLSSAKDCFSDWLEESP